MATLEEPDFIFAARRLRDMPRWKDSAGKTRSMSEREPELKVHPEAAQRLRDFLQTGPGARTGIGFTEFIDQSMNLWETIERCAYDRLIEDGLRVELAPPYECDDCHRTDGTHDPEVEH